MTDREPNDEELAKTSEEVEGHSIEEEEEGEAAGEFDVNFGCCGAAK
jgi:hypothetical protein